jgi:uracil-DNA glycosylase
VLLINRCLTVREGQPNSHSGLGWEEFTEMVIRTISNKKDPVVFLLWGSKARTLKSFIQSHHLVLESVHPSPFSADKGWWNCNHFLETNRFLKEIYNETIDW